MQVLEEMNFMDILVIELSLKTNISKFCPDPTYNEWNPKVVLQELIRRRALVQLLTGSSIRFISDDTLCRTRYEKIKPHFNC